tara:strand:+ start:120 stop:467 length:348 start_codon:yes stop_codon:yes gene_type:complete
MFNIKKIIFVVLSLILSVSANAAIDDWTGSKSVVKVQIVQHGGILIYFDSAVNAVCSAAGTKSIYVYPGQAGVTEAGIKAFTSVALTALSTGMKVSVLYDDSSSHCWGQYIVISK